MSSKIDKIMEHIQRLEGELEIELNKKNENLRAQISALDKQLSEKYRSARIGVLRYLREANILVILTAPIIYSLIIPFVLIDLMASIYQAICFRVYKIEQVKRKDYFNYDRAKLSYLNIIEKLNCTYCSYGNGVLAYVQEIAARTEKFWCPIKHAARIKGVHKYYREFEEYGDGEHYQEQLAKLRAELNEEDEGEEK